MKLNLLGSFSLAVVVSALGATPADAAKPAAAAAAKPATVELFDAMKSGDIEVKLILKDSTTGTVTIANKTKKPLAIKLPEAFAGVPALAQFGGGGGGMMGGGGGMMGGGGGMFNVPAEKVGKLKVVTVCLEHGKKDPNTRVAYDLKPIESFTKNPEVIELVKMVGRGEIRQHTAQAVAWHLANDLSWQQLARKIGVKHLNGTTKPYFTQGELETAVRIAQEATRRAEDYKTAVTSVESPGQAATVQ